MRAAASAMAEQRPMRRASARVRWSAAPKSFTSHATLRPRFAVSKRVTGAAPESPRSSAA